MADEFELRPTTRGFLFTEWLDTMRQRCSLQKSSVADEDRIWLGVEDYRMHLNQEMVAALLPLLQRFVETGELAITEVTDGPSA